MREFMDTVTYEMNDLGCIKFILIISLRFTCKFKYWVLNQILVSDRTYLIRVFQKTSIIYLWCIDQCVLHMIVDDGFRMKLSWGHWY